jgi:hypothetical protein
VTKQERWEREMAIRATLREEARKAGARRDRLEFKLGHGGLPLCSSPRWPRVFTK